MEPTNFDTTEQLRLEQAEAWWKDASVLTKISALDRALTPVGGLLSLAPERVKP
jgi:hypothetical protein